MCSIPFIQRIQTAINVSGKIVFMFLQRLAHRKVLWFRIQMRLWLMTIPKKATCQRNSPITLTVAL